MPFDLSEKIAIGFVTAASIVGILRMPLACALLLACAFGALVIGRKSP